MITTEQIALVRNSWKLMQSHGLGFADVLYEELFAAEPQLRILFEGPMDEQHRKLTAIIGQALDMLENQEELKHKLHDLGARHATYGVREHHFEALGKAWVAAADRQLGTACTPEVRSAWEAFYALLKEGMLEGAALVPEAH